jgi:MoaA/NifB/PqqE/SkfB family radical SAM enzyme
MSIIRRWKNTYYIPGMDSRTWADAAKRLLLRGVPAFPRVIQIQTQTGCNGACVFCPYEASRDAVPKGKMPDGLYARLLDEIAQDGTARRISPFLMNEPFLDRNLLEKARLMKRRVPRARVLVTTNAGVLHPSVVDDLVHDNPFHAVYISMQGVEKEPYEDTMRGALAFEKTMGNVEYLIARRNAHAPKLKIVVTMVKTNKIDAEKAVAFWKARGVEAQYTCLESRGGNNSAFNELNAGDKRVFKDCTRLLKHAYILLNGDMVLCCTDYYKTMVLGNVAESSIRDVWNSPRAREIRRNFLLGNLSKVPLCARCFVSTVA